MMNKIIHDSEAGAWHPRKGFRFYHKRFLDTQAYDGKSLQEMVVTKVNRGLVYYRPVYKYPDREVFGMCFHSTIETFPLIVGRTK